MARKRARAAPPGDYNVAVGNRGSFHLDRGNGHAQYWDGLDSVQIGLDYRGETTWKGVPCSVFKETKTANSQRDPKYGWLFSALEDAGSQQISKVGFVALEDIDTLEIPDVLTFGDAVYTPMAGRTDLDALREYLRAPNQ